MPKITIRERDLTSAGNLETTTNAVYIPGYSNMGPVNEPILCETLQDFQMVFGSEPYKFRTQQPWPTSSSPVVVDSKNYAFSSDAVPATGSTMGNMYEDGELEKSYTMAVELLKLGLPVLYERVASADVIDNWTASIPVHINKFADDTPIISEGDNVNNIGFIAKATFPGLVSKDIYFTLNLHTVTIISGSTTAQSDYYTIAVGRKKNVDLGTSEISPIETMFTFDPQVAAEYTSCRMVYPNQVLEDNSGLLNLEFSNDVKPGTLLDYLAAVGSDEPLKLYNLEFSATQLDKIQNTNGIGFNDEFTVKTMYEVLLTSGVDVNTGEYKGLDKLLDKGEYIIKFITTGAYPAFEFAQNAIAQKLVEVAANRGDCTALLDHTPNNTRTAFAKASNSVFSKVSDFARSNVKNELGEDAFTYAAMFTPYGVYTCSSIGKQVMLPASFGYLAALAASVQVNGNWMAAAGVQRGGVPNLVALSQNITNAIADSYQNRDAISINPITNIKPYGLIIWGNRTLKNNAKAGDLTATSFLSIRQLTNDVKRTVYVAAKSLTFEQNNDILWINFKSKIIPTLDQMVSGSGLSGYEIKKQKTTKKATIKAVVRLYAIEPVEDWDITIELADSSTEIVG